MSIQDEIIQIGQQARRASAAMAKASSEQKNRAGNTSALCRKPTKKTSI